MFSLCYRYCYDIPFYVIVMLLLCYGSFIGSLCCYVIVISLLRNCYCQEFSCQRRGIVVLSSCYCAIVVLLFWHLNSESEDKVNKDK